jgi:hypothetical protein
VPDYCAAGQEQQAGPEHIREFLFMVITGPDHTRVLATLLDVGWMCWPCPARKATSHLVSLPASNLRFICCCLSAATSR